MATGAVMTDLKLIVEGLHIILLLLACNQTYNIVGMLRYTSGGNFKIRIVICGLGGFVWQLGAERSQRLEAYFQAIPGSKTVACCTPCTAKGLLKSAIRYENHVIFSTLLYFTTYNIYTWSVNSKPPDKAEKNKVLSIL
jgi:pyruvate dehydrogenase E1 component beta subunit